MDRRRSTTRFARAAAIVATGAMVACSAATPAPGDDDGTAAGERSAAKKPVLPTAQCEGPAGGGGPGWLRDGFGYQIWVRSFFDSDGDGIGDLNGIRAKLDYINDGKPEGSDLGASVIWLSPIFASPSDHGYDTTDHLAIQPEYGTPKDLQALLAAAHKRGVKVMLDLVVNHISDKHPWFKHAAASKKSVKRPWFVWRKDDPGWTQPWGKNGVWHERNGSYYYGLFTPQMPDLHVANPDVAKALTDIFTHWLDAGVDGFRLDAARYLVETGGGPGQADTQPTHAFWQKWRNLADTRGDIALFGEVWTKATTVATYLQGNELHGCFDFDLAAGIRKGLQLRTSAMFRQALCKTAAIDKAVWGRFAGNHDMRRIADIAENKTRVGLALASVMLVPGMPWIYYGDELGVPSGDGGGDRAYRLPMPWSSGEPNLGFGGKPWIAVPASYVKHAVKDESKDSNSLLTLVRELARIRGNCEALRRGPVRLLDVPGDDGMDVAVMQLGRWDKVSSERALVVLNFSDDAAFTVPADWLAGGKRVVLPGKYAGSGAKVSGSGLAIWAWPSNISTGK